jgi:hypothetical protein
VEPKKRITLHVKMERDPRVQFPEVTSEVKLQVAPDRVLALRSYSNKPDGVSEP